MANNLTINLMRDSPSLVADSIAWAVGGAVATAVLSNPIGLPGGAICGGVGYLAGLNDEWVVSIFSDPNSSFASAVISTISVAIRVFSVMAVILALAPLLDIQITLLGSFIFSSVVYTIAPGIRPLIPSFPFLAVRRTKAANY